MRLRSDSSSIKRALTGALLAAALASLSASGCSDVVVGFDGAGGGDLGDGGEPLRIQPFSMGQVTLIANQSYDLSVNLSHPVTETTHVDVGNLASLYLTTSPLALRYAKGEDQQTATIKAVQQTNDTYQRVRFTLRGTKTSRTFQVKVKLF